MTCKIVWQGNFLHILIELAMFFFFFFFGARSVNNNNCKSLSFTNLNIHLSNVMHQIV